MRRMTPTIVAVNHTADQDRREVLPEGWTVWSTAAPAGVTYHRIAETAVAEGWDQTTIVVQDDIRWTSPPEPHKTTDLVLYGGYQADPLHACPRAFAASPTAWRALELGWADHPDRLCPAFMEAMAATTVMILDQTEHTEPTGSRTWPRRTAA